MTEPYGADPRRRNSQHRASAYPAGPQRYGDGPWRDDRQWQGSRQWQDERRPHDQRQWHDERGRQAEREWPDAHRRYDHRHRNDDFQPYDAGTVRTKRHRVDASRWHWLLLVAVILPLATPLYNRTEPQLFGLPFFYWCQLAFAVLSSVVILTVHLATKGRGHG